MASFGNFIQEHFARVRPLAPGMYASQSGPDETPSRLHLRLERDGSGILVVNASTVLHLNPTAAEYAFYLIKKTAPEEAARQVAARYRISPAVARKDYDDFCERVRTLITTPDLDPGIYLDFERVAPHSQELAAPLRLDCALTYRLPPGSHVEYAPARRVDR